MNEEGKMKNGEWTQRESACVSSFFIFHSYVLSL